jgi:hypothetical protein
MQWNGTYPLWSNDASSWGERDQTEVSMSMFRPPQNAFGDHDRWLDIEEVAPRAAGDVKAIRCDGKSVSRSFNLSSSRLTIRVLFRPPQVR